jgi:taurine dioxygenase
MEQRIEVVPLAVGAEVVGSETLDLADPAVRAALYAAWLEHGVLVFHNVATPERHIELSRCFGDLEIHPFPEARAPENDLFIEIGGGKQTPPILYDGTELRVNRIPWHRDTAYTPDLCKGAMLRMVEVPPVEGETLFADTAKAYDALPQAMKDRLEQLEYRASLRLGSINQTRPGALWHTAQLPNEDPTRSHELPFGLEAERRYPPVVHPAVLTHPESGRKCVFLSPTYVDHFIGLSEAESGALLEELVAHLTRPEFVYRHSWTVNDAIVWDNRRFMHAASGNRVGDRRRGLRTTLAGQLSIGRYFHEEAAAPTGPALVD